MSIRWGILGTGKIAEKFVEDFKFVKNGKVLAVGSRSEKKARAFAKKYNIKNVHGSYEQLALDTEIDVIYIATPHNLHFENTALCLTNNKAVLCEKPFTVNASELERLIRLAREKDLFLMEALWTYFLPAINKVMEWIKAGKIGEVQTVKADFGFKPLFDPTDRLFDPSLAGGALLDLGIYPIIFSELIMNDEIESIDASAQFGKTNVDYSNSMVLKYRNGKTAQLSSSLVENLKNDGYIYGTKGSIHLPNFWSAKTAFLKSDDGDDSFDDKRNSHGYNYEIEEVNTLLIAGKKESLKMPLSQSLKVMRIMDEVRKQIKLKYPFE